MGTQKNTITINGKLYDINSGQQITKYSSKDSNIGIKEKKDVSQSTETSNNKGSESSEKNQSTASIARGTQVNPASRQINRANTLARNFVKKPTRPKVDAIQKELYPKRVELHKTVDTDRLIRAQSATQNTKVSKFGNSASPSITRSIANMDVVPEPKTNNGSYDISDTPPAPRVSSPTQANSSKGSALFESALKSSDSHKEEFNEKKDNKKIARIISGTLVATLAFGFVVYQNIPNISLKSASARIGFNASIPSYKPSGFGLEDSIKYQTGRVSINFRSNSDDRNYTIEQTKSELDSASLLNNYLISDKKEYQTETTNGRTVYIYDGSSATWVDGGVWYKLTDNAHLSKEQILKIVSSI